MYIIHMMSLSEKIVNMWVHTDIFKTAMTVFHGDIPQKIVMSVVLLALVHHD